MGVSVTTAVPKPTEGWLGWRVLSLLTLHRRTVAGLVALIGIASVLDIAVPFFTRNVIDGIVHAVSSRSPGAVETLLLSAAAIFGLTACTRILRSLYSYRLFLTAAKCEDKVKNEAFANFLRLDTEYHGKVNTGEVIGSLDRGGTAVMVVLAEIFGQNLLPPLLIVLGVLITLSAKNLLIAAIVFLPLPAYVFAVGRLSSRMHKLETQVSQAFENVTKESYDIASNVRLVKKFCQEKREALTQLDLLGIARERQFRGERLWAVIENVQSFIATAGRVGVITFGGYLVLTRRCSIGEYVLFIALQDMVYGPISQLSIILPKLRRNLSRAERLFQILDERPAVRDAHDADVLPPVESDVEFKNLCFRYSGSEDWALRGVNFKVPAGVTVALIGPSGSGKTTLMNLLQRLYDPQAGSVLIGGRDLRTVTQESLREQIAVVLQEVDLFSRSVIENIGYGSNLPRHELEHAAGMAQAHEFISHCAAGYDTQVGERGLRLSGGERQRLGIARAMVRDPKILILDEATSALDNESERLIQLALEKLAKNRTCFIIAHRLSTVRKADLVVVFANGTVEAVGTHDELWQNSPTYRKLHHVADMPKRPFLVPAEAGEQVLQPAV
jgi:ABC-type multidrug transport system fused ATPase/permease subunit